MATVAPMFRTVLPHEAPLCDSADEMGYLHVQGSLTPKLNDADNAKEGSSSNEVSSVIQTKEFWVNQGEQFEFMLLHQFRAIVPSLLGAQLSRVQRLDPVPPYTKFRLHFASPSSARQSMFIYRRLNLSPILLVSAEPIIEDEATLSLRSLLLQHSCSNQNISTMSGRPLQISEITARPLHSQCPHWTRSTPPKFRRLVSRPGEDDCALEHERQTTRFVVLTNLLPESNAATDTNNHVDWESHPHAIAHAIRSIMTPFDTSDGCNLEVFVPSQASKRTRYCHVGMRSAADAQAVVTALQEQIVEWPWLTASTTTLNESTSTTCTTIKSGKLFVDYAAVTQRSETNATVRDTGTGEEERGQRARSRCTSTTDHVHIPGLILIEDFVSVAEEAALMAVLTGPQAPWAPAQPTASHPEAAVRRAVQHYGYVFDYQTADVLRDRSARGADCPPMPALSEQQELLISDTASCQPLNDYIRDCLDEGRGWDVLAGVIQRTRRQDFRQDSTTAGVTFPLLNQLTVNHYAPGEGIGTHVDTPSAFSDGLISLSLNGGIVMEFRRVHCNDKETDTKKLVYLPPRSLLLMSSDARYNWEHMIVSRMTDTHNDVVLTRKLRVSLTLRTALAVDGVTPLPLVESAIFPPVWGDHKASAATWTNTPSCERDHVHAVYDAIATQWHHTRGKRGVMWPGATQFLQRLSPGSIVADVGCGDGKYFPAIWEAGSYVIGTDISEPLLRTAMSDDASCGNQLADTQRISEDRYHLRKRPALVVADCMNIPLRTSSCDAAICIAVLHHLSTLERRRRCIEELVRIVKPGGVVNVQAWALEQDDTSRRKFASNDVYVPFNAQPKYLNMNSSSRDDATVATKLGSTKSTAQIYSEALNAEYDDRKGLVIFNRYCHMYRKGELDEIAREVPGVVLIETGFESGNYYIIFEVQK